jgi:AcrR family transcriptional regulator
MPPKTVVDKKRVLELAEQGIAVAAIAERLGINKASVYDVLRPLKKGYPK